MLLCSLWVWPVWWISDPGDTALPHELPREHKPLRHAGQEPLDTLGLFMSRHLASQRQASFSSPPLPTAFYITLLPLR